MRELILKREIIVDKATCRIIGVITFVLLSCFGAYIRIPLPFTPVPITLQTFFVLLSGAVLGKFGIISQSGYIILGILGLSVFSNAGSGIIYLLGPTGGYLIGFLLASYLTGKVTYNKESYLSIFISMCIANLAILSSGTIWLKFSLRIGIDKALFLGFFPFLLGDLLKIMIASFLSLKIKSRIREIL